jgi:hypothetical protein
LLNTVTGAVGGATGSGGSSSPLAPVTSLVGGVSGSASSGSSTGLLAPVTGLLGTLGSVGKEDGRARAAGARRAAVPTRPANAARDIPVSRARKQRR